VGDLFVALSFADADAHAWVEEALSRGAAIASVSERWGGLSALSPALRARCVTVIDVLASFRKLAAVFRARLPYPVVAVAGSNGKTTTKEMLCALLSGPGHRVVKTPGTDNGFVGLPRTLCSREHHRDAAPDALVLEIGIDARGAMQEHARMVAPDMVVMTALGPEHLDGLGDEATAVEEELRLFDEAPGARRVVHWGDPEIERRAGNEKRAGIESWTGIEDQCVIESRGGTEGQGVIGSRSGIEEQGVIGSRSRIEERGGIEHRGGIVRDGDVAVVSEVEWAAGAALPPRGAVLVYRSVSSGEASELTVRWYPEGGRRGLERSGWEPAWEGDLHIPMPGRHNAGNAALAVAAALALGRAGPEMLLGWQTFEPPPWRSRIVPLVRGAILYDDCFNASPLSMRAAFSALEDPAWAGRPRIAVLGDMLDLGAESLQWHLELAGALEAMEGVQLFLFGRAMEALGERLRAAGHGDKVRRAVPGGDPVALVSDSRLPDNAIVLVKGSRGMRMERVTRHLEERWGRESASGEGVSCEGASPEGVPRRSAVREGDPRETVTRESVPRESVCREGVSGDGRALWAGVATVAVTGSYGVESVVTRVITALGCFGSDVVRFGAAGAFFDGERVAVGPGEEGWAELSRRCAARGRMFAVAEVHHERLLMLGGGHELAVAVFTGLSEEDLPEGGDAERHLAEKAQLFVGRCGPRAVVLNADDPASELLAEVLAPGVRVLRYGTLGVAHGPVDLLATSVERTARGTSIRLTVSPELRDVMNGLAASPELRDSMNRLTASPELTDSTVRLAGSSELAGSPGLPEWVELADDDPPAAHAVMAAILVVLALGGSMQRAAEMVAGCER